VSPSGARGGTLRLVLGDQLTPDLASLRDGDRDRDVVLLAEVRAEATYVRHHKKKIAFIFAAMRHFAGELRDAGWTVRHVAITDADNAGDLLGEVGRTLALFPALQSVCATRCGEWRLDRQMRDWDGALPVPVEIREDDRFICSHARFATWAAGRKQYRMEYFYREMRRETGLLIEPDGSPSGGQWNFDADNRKKPPPGTRPPVRAWIVPDAVTREAMADVDSLFGDHFGDLEPFGFATRRSDAEAIAATFVETILPGFGDWQDAMIEGQPWMWHSILSVYLNVGLLDPLALCRMAEAQWRAGRAPLNAVEGFIRQILGWREYVRGIYWELMPEYGATNALEAHGALPAFYWTGDTPMACMADAVASTRQHAYAHHIQRLMVTGNFALLAGIDPVHVNEWYMVVYADAFEWVELPNTHGMALFADGGVMASKPYAASGAYIDRMSDHCKGCRFDVQLKAGTKACPFNYLYWDFIGRNEDRLKGNPRLSNPLATWRRFDADRQGQIKADADRFLKQVGVRS
jgi:deoxyribodipyrimidine photolyase-related protein